MICIQAPTEICKADKTAFGPRGQAEISLKIEDLRSNKTTGKLLRML